MKFSAFALCLLPALAGAFAPASVQVCSVGYCDEGWNLNRGQMGGNEKGEVEDPLPVPVIIAALQTFLLIIANN